MATEKPTKPRFPAPSVWRLAPFAAAALAALLGDLWLAFYVGTGVAAFEIAVIVFVWHPPLFLIVLPLPIAWTVAFTLWLTNGAGRPEGAAAHAGAVLAVLWLLVSAIFMTGPHVARRCMRRKIGFGDLRTHEVVVPAGPDGRPGERVLAFSKTLLRPRVLVDGGRSDFRVLVGTGGSAVSALCLGPTTEQGEARENAEKKVESMREQGSTSQAELRDDQIAGEPAVSIRWSGRSKFTAIDWRFCHAGWTYSAGVLCCPRDDEAEMVTRAREVLDSWRWIEATTTGSPESQPPPATTH